MAASKQQYVLLAGESQQDAGRDRVAGARMMLTPQAAISEANEAHTPQKNGSCINQAMEASYFREKKACRDRGESPGRLVTPPGRFLLSGRMAHNPS